MKRRSFNADAAGRTLGLIMLLVAACLIAGLQRQVAAQDNQTNEAVPADPPTAGEPVSLNEEPAPLNGDPLQLNFKDVVLDEVLEFLSQRAGLVVVKTGQVEGRITILSRQPMALPEVTSLLNTVLKEKGYAAILMGRTLKIVDVADASKQSIPVRSGADPQAIPQNDQIVTQVMPLRYAEVDKLAEDLRPLLPGYAVLAANVRSNSLILTDTSANIHRIAHIVQALDRNIANAIGVRVFALQYADAADTARLINELFGDTQAAQTRNDSRRVSFMRRLWRRGRDGGGGNEESESSGQPQMKVTAAGDERTNTVVATGPSDTLEVIGQVIEELDANPQSTQDVMIYPVRNGMAEQLAETLNELFDEQEQTSGRAGAAGGRQQQRNFGGRSARDQGAASEPAVGADLVGQVHMVAETDTNTLLVMANPKNFARVRQIIDQLDRTVPQVLIRVLIAEVTHDRSNQHGVEWSILKDNNDFDLLSNFDPVDRVTGGLTFSLAKKELDATLKALEEVGKLDVLSRPYILAHENQEASITVGQEVPYITSSFQTETGGLRNTINYQDIGIILKVTPHINPEGLVVMDVAPEISTISDSTVPISEDFDAAIFNKRSAFARVAIRDGQTIVIGGLIQDQLNDTVRKVPVLGDIPLLGELFKSTVTKKTKTELLLFLTPEVVRNPDALEALSDAERRGARLMSDAVAPGTFQEHLEGMKGSAVAPEPAP